MLLLLLLLLLLATRSPCSLPLVPSPHHCRVFSTASPTAASRWQDDSGKITVDEFNGACERLGVPLNRKETRAFFAVYDTDGSGTITYEEFVKNVYGDDE